MAIQLPPQAYTRDTFVQAYEWLQSQPGSIRELASSPDALVSLFLQARRRGGVQAVSTNPVSSQAFKQDLKNLAEGLRQFEEHEGHGGATIVPPMAPPPAPNPNMHAAGASANPTVNVVLAPNYPQHQQMQMPTPAPLATTSSYLAEEDIYASLDSKSHEMVRRVQSRFNLSTEKESLRLLIAMGFDKVREMLPKG